MIEIVLVILLLVFMILRNEPKYSYETYLLTLPQAEERREVFFRHNGGVNNVHVVYGQDTRDIETARKFEHHVQPEFFDKAVEMHYDSGVVRPNITYFNLGAIGCHMGHMDIWTRARDAGHKYILVFEDNVVVKSPKLYDEVEKFIKEKGDNFEACFFHCLHYLPRPGRDVGRVLWISSTKCYLLHVPNMQKYAPSFFPMDNHVDMKFEDIIADGARVYYRDMRKFMVIDRRKPSLIGHSAHDDEDTFSRRYPKVHRSELIKGW